MQNKNSAIQIMVIIRGGIGQANRQGPIAYLRLFLI